MDKIAIMAWGSLTWDPRELKIRYDWADIGPELPMEFARISRDGRLTLVLGPQFQSKNKTWIAQSCYTTVPNAVADLYLRETGMVNRFSNEFDNRVVGFYRKSQKRNGVLWRILDDWLDKTDYDAIIWTKLESNIPDDFDPLDHIDSLTAPMKYKALEYVFKAPLNIQTPTRSMIQQTYKHAESWFI